jgi:hypothetical protein
MPQRTPLQAYQHVLRAIDAGTINPERMNLSGGCQYRMQLNTKRKVNTINCGVGSLFNEAQLADIEKRGANCHSVGALGTDIGWDNLLEVTGLDNGRLRDLQCKHDGAGTKVQVGWNVVFRRYVVKCIEELS